MKIIILICLLAFMAISCSPAAAPEPQPSIPPTQPEAPAPIPESKPKPAPQSFEPIIITGSGGKTSPPFTITTKEWIIDWSYIASEPEYAVFGFFIYPRGETTIFVESVLFPESSSGSTYSYAGPGEYYVEVTSANIKSWEIVIKPAP